MYFTSIGCKPEHTAQQRCWDDCDLKWRQCLVSITCIWFPPNTSSCSYEGINFCTSIFKLCKLECPCGDQEASVLGEFKEIENEALCLNGCPCPETATKKDFCSGNKDEIIVLQNGKNKSLNYIHDMKSRMNKYF